MVSLVRWFPFPCLAIMESKAFPPPKCNATTPISKIRGPLFSRFIGIHHDPIPKKTSLFLRASFFFWLGGWWWHCRWVPFIDSPQIPDTHGSQNGWIQTLVKNATEQWKSTWLFWGIYGINITNLGRAYDKPWYKDPIIEPTRMTQWKVSTSLF